MPESENKKESFIYASENPEVEYLRSGYLQTTDDLSSYFHRCRDSYNYRNNKWAGKTKDLRKNAVDAFPWQGAADMEAHVISERINAYVALCVNSLNRANVQAYPSGVNNMSRAAILSGFLKWMVTSYIPRFRKEMELAANSMLEKGIAVTYVGWNREDRTFVQRYTLEEIAAQDPEIARAVLEGTNDAEFAGMLQEAWPTVSNKRAKKALKDLRKTGVAELTVVKRSVNAPSVQTLSPNGEFFFPAYVFDPQRAPYCFWRTYLTPQELKNKISTDGWDDGWVNYVIENHGGIKGGTLDESEGANARVQIANNTYESEDLVEVIYGYRRLIDREDNSEGIYCTVFHPDFSSEEMDDGGVKVQPYAKHELLNGFEDYPVVVTRLSEASKCLYDTESMAELLKGPQWQVKIERDSRIDRNSLTTVPTMNYQIGSAAPQWGPARQNAIRRGGEITYAPTPPYNPGSIEMEDTMLKQADSLVGLNADDPLSAIKRQFVIDKFLQHGQEVIKLAYKAFMKFGPAEIAFRVTGAPEGQMFEKGDDSEKFEVMIGYDVMNSDPETQKAKLEQFVALKQLDVNGRLDMDKLISVIAGSIDPMLADAVMQPAEQAQEQITKKVLSDLTNIFAGIERPALPNGAQIATGIIQQYAQQPDIMERMSSDKPFEERLTKYFKQYKHDMDQAQNAETGKNGTQAAAVGDVKTQNMQQ